MSYKSQRGSIMVFVSIILTATIFLAGTLVEAGRMRIANTQATRALMNAKDSVLAGYDSRLKDEYGLFAIADYQDIEVINNLNYFLHAALRPHKSYNQDGIEVSRGSYWNFFDYNVESISVTPYHNLNDYRVIKEQILEFMKFRAPFNMKKRLNRIKGLGGATGLAQSNAQSELLLNVLSNNPENAVIIYGMANLHRNKLVEIRDSGSIMEKQVKLDRKLMKVGTLLVDIEKKIDTLNSFDKNSFNTNMELIHSLATEYGNFLTSAEADRESLNSEIHNINLQISDLEADDNDTRQALMENLEALESELDMLGERVDQKHHELMDKINSVNLSVDNVHESARGVPDLIEEALRELESLKNEIESFGYYLEHRKDSQVYSVARQTYERYRQLNIEGLEEAKDSAEENLAILYQGLEKIENIRREAARLGAISSGERNEIINNIGNISAEARSIFNHYRSELKKPKAFFPVDSVEQPIEDPRESIAERATSKINDAVRQIPGGFIPASIVAQLPSRLELVHKEPIIDTQTELMKIEFDENNEEGFLDRMFSNVNTTLGQLPQVQTVKYPFYLSEYATGTFLSATTIANAIANGIPVVQSLETKGTQETKGNKDSEGTIEQPLASLESNLMNNPKINRPRVLNFELEYILFGSSNDMTNLLFAIGSIKAIRFVSNLAYVITNPNYQKIAIAASAKTLNPLFIPLVKTMIFAALAMKYTYEDIMALLTGADRPVFQGNEKIRMNYEDYLYSFLVAAFVVPEKKLMRINDLIQLNMQPRGLFGNGFQMKEFYTYIDTELSVSISNIFLNLFAQYEEDDSIDRSRHEFKIIVMDGY